MKSVSMKSVSLFSACGLAIVLAGWSVWTATAVQQDDRQRWFDLGGEIDRLDSRMQGLAGMLEVALAGSAEPRSDPARQPSRPDGQAGRISRLDDRLRDQGRARDNQWQEIDRLDSDQVTLRRLVDQLRYDLDKLHRLQTETARKLRSNSGSNQPSIDNSIADLKQRLDLIERRFRR